MKYLSYNFPITENDLNVLNLCKVFTAEDVKSIIDMSEAKNREILYKIGVAAGENSVKAKDIPI